MNRIESNWVTSAFKPKPIWFRYNTTNNGDKSAKLPSLIAQVKLGSSDPTLDGEGLKLGFWLIWLDLGVRNGIFFFGKRQRMNDQEVWLWPVGAKLSLIAPLLALVGSLVSQTPCGVVYVKTWAVNFLPEHGWVVSLIYFLFFEKRNWSSRGG